MPDLTHQEQYELDTLLARAGAATPKETWAKVPLTAAEEDRLMALAAQVRVVEPGSWRENRERRCQPRW